MFDLSRQERLSETLTVRITKRDLAMLEKIASMRREDASTFIRRAMLKEFAELGFLSEEERQALGIGVDGSRGGEEK